MKKHSFLLFAIPVFLVGGLHTNSSFSLPPQERSPDPFQNGILSAEIKMHNGAPTLFLDGRPVFYGAWWVSPPQTRAGRPPMFRR